MNIKPESIDQSYYLISVDFRVSPTICFNVHSFYAPLKFGTSIDDEHNI